MSFDSGTMLETMDTLTSDHTSVVSITLFMTLLCACIVIGRLLEENRWMNESISALIIGVAIGVVILLISKGKSSQLLVFSEELFFIYLLPPIIFNAGYMFGLSANNAGLLVLLDRSPHMGQWRCINWTNK